MSRLGKMPIELPKGTEVKLEPGLIRVKGPMGQLEQKFPESVKVEVADNQIKVSVKDPENKKQRSFWGLFRTLIKNMVQGVNEGFEKKLEVNGVGYKVVGGGNKLTLNLGYSHQINFDLQEGVQAEIAGKIITIKGIDKQLVGETAAQIRKLRKPEPYKGKGIKYIDEVIRRKSGKTASGTAS
ncbi:MAG: 50S ribosomal protein L6 [bacterium]